MSDNVRNREPDYIDDRIQGGIRNVNRSTTSLEAESIDESLAERSNVDDKYSCKKHIVKTSSKTKELSLIFFSIFSGALWGVLGRKGLMALSTYNGSFISGVIWANFAACVVMGIAVESENPWRELLESEIYANKGSIGVYVGITTGFCGTLSSFSSMILEAFNKSANTLPGDHYNYPNAAYGIMEFLAVIIVHMCLSATGFQVGKHCTEVFDRYFPVIKQLYYKTLEIIWIATGVIGFVVTIVLTGVMHHGAWRSWTFACIFAPFGALLRFYLSKFLNRKVKNFPLGTFVANFGGSLLLAIFVLLQRGKLPHHPNKQICTHVLGCQVLNGLDDGFCGALTTVSTFIVELSGLNTLHSYRYGFYSIITSYISMVLILGVFNWTVGLTDAICV